jgi:hypothetical protein
VSSAAEIAATERRREVEVEGRSLNSVGRLCDDDGGNDVHNDRRVDVPPCQIRRLIGLRRAMKKPAKFANGGRQNLAGKRQCDRTSISRDFGMSRAMKTSGHRGSTGSSCR